MRWKTSWGTILKDRASDLTDTVTPAAKAQLGELSAAAKDYAAEARGKVEAAMNDQKTAGADYIGQYASAVHRAAGEFETDTPQVARYIRQGAAEIETVAKAVRGRDLRELVGEVEDFARRQPTLFLAEHCSSALPPCAS